MKKPKEWLSVRDFGLGGVHHDGWWPPLFAQIMSRAGVRALTSGEYRGNEAIAECGFFDTADNVAIDTFWQKYTIWQKSGVSAIVYRERVKRNRIYAYTAL